jgi:hypothetical protein
MNTASLAVSTPRTPTRVAAPALDEAAPGMAAPELALLLQAVRPEADRAALTAALATPGIHWNRLVTMARTHGIVALLYRTLRAAPEGLVPAEVLGTMQRDFHRLSMLIQLQTSTLVRLMKELDGQALVLKGLPLGSLAHGQTIWRKPGDIDLLVRPERYPAFCRTIEGLGFLPDLSGAAAERELRWKKQMTFRGSPCDVDVHLSLEQSSFLRIPYASGFDAERIWARSQTVTLAGTPVPTLGPEDLFGFLCIHGAKHGWYLYYMIADIAALAANARLDWDRVAVLMRSLRADRYVGLSLLLAHRFAGLRLPPPFVHLNEHRTLVALATRIGERLFGSAPRLHPISFHLLQAQILPGALDRGRYFVNVCVEHFRRKRRVPA